MLANGALTTKTKADKPAINALKGVGLNLVVLPGEALHLMQDGVIVELTARKQRGLQVISKQKINNTHMGVQRDSAITSMMKLTDMNQRMIKVVDEACRMVLKLAIPTDESVDVRVLNSLRGCTTPTQNWQKFSWS